MASINQPQSGQPLPAPAQIALALAVLKSKPREAPIDDYLAQLRDLIVEGCTPARIPVARHLDGATYWKKAFDRAEEEKNALMDRLHDLEKAKAATTLLSSPPARSPVARDRKRRREDTPAAKANSRSKRRANHPGASEPPPENDASPGNDEVLVAREMSTDITKLLQAFYTLRIHLRSQPTALSAVHSSASRLCNTISTTVRSVDSNIETDKNCSDEHTGVWSAIRRTYNSLLYAVELLYAHSSSAGSAGNLISKLAKILIELLKFLQSIAVQEQPKGRGARTRSDSRDVDNQILGLTNLISGMMIDLDLAKAAHRELFDGLLCTFLDHLGSSLSLAVFSEPMNKELPPPIGLLPPRGLITGVDDQTQVDVSTSLKVSPYLINILRKMKPRMDERGNIDNDGYSGAVVNRMQNTLLRALFGDQDQAFRDSLRRPADVETIDDKEDLMVGTAEGITSEWFIGEVWSNVGWDILTKHIN